MKNKLRIFLVVSMLAGSSICSFAQTFSPVISEKSLDANSPYSVQTWNTENGLPQNSINDITQTDNGYLWIATFDGIARFDGITFTYYNTANNPAFKSNAIKRVFVANDHQLFTLTADGELLAYQKNIFSEIKNQPESFNTSNGSVAYNATTNELFLLSKNNHLYQFAKGIFTRIHLSQQIDINALCFSAEDELFIASYQGLFHYLDKQLIPIKNLKNINVDWLESNSEHTLFGHSSEGYFVLKNKKQTFIQLPKKYSNYIINDIGFDDKNNLTLLSDNGFIELTDTSATVMNSSDGLPSNSISSIYKDRQNNLWIGTGNAGLCKLKRKIASILLVKDAQNADDITGITQLKNGSILFGNFCGGMSCYLSGKISHLNEPKNACVYSIAEDNQSTQWISTYGNGVYAIHPLGEIKKYSYKDGLPSNVVFVTYADNQGTIWLGTDSGLCFVDHNLLKRYDPNFTSNVKQMMEDASGRLFIASDKGLGELENDKVKWLNDQKDSTLKLKNVRSIYEDADGTLWIGTYGNGLFKYKNGNFFSFLHYTNVLGINTSCIVEDEKNNFWMSSNSGMYVVNKNNLINFSENPTIPLNITYLSNEDGIKNSEFNGGFQGSALKTNAGLLFFPTVKGMVLIHPKQLSTPTVPSNIIIEKIIIANTSEIPVSDTIPLSYFVKEIKIKYSIPCFNNADKIQFQYQLTGSSNAWINVGTTREIELSNLPYGFLMLRIRTINTPLNSEKIIYIIHRQPIWETEEFIVIAILLFALLLLFFTWIRIKHIEKREKAKTELHQKYANIELKALQAQMNPHFLFNCLNAIQHFVLINDEVSANKYLTKFATLMRNYLEHSKKNRITLQEECDLLKLYVELESLRFNGRFNYIFVIAPEINAFEVEIPSMLFQPFVENAINHGLRNLERKGSLTISFRLENNCIIGIVDDDGVGRAFEKNNFQTSAEHISRGMEIINERIHVLNSMEKAQIKLSIIDKMDVNHQSLGTSIRIEIPI
ncbi:MAG: two-component regulator propeller domain-containing protein [Bacteroidia bacterium]